MDFLKDLAIAGFALAPLATVVVQVIKVIGARLGLPEGYSGWLTLIVSVALVGLAGSAELIGNQARVAENLAAVQAIAEAMLTMLGALGFYQASKIMNISRPVNWRD